MPTIQSMELPIPKNWQDFETIVRDAQAQRWKTTALQKNGRPGQKQHGVDIVGPDEIGRRVGVQCKRYKTPLTLETVTDEVANAEDFKPKLSALFIASTADHDSKLQERVRVLSDKRSAKGRFAVALLFWDEIVSSLLLNPAVFRAHYPQIELAKADHVDKERLIAALELGYFGADLWLSVLLIYGEFGSMAQADPDEFIASLRTLERRAQQLLPPDDAVPILHSLSEVRNGCLKPKRASSDWNPIETFAKRVSSRIQSVQSLISFPESKALDIGLQLGRLYHHADDVPAAAVRRQVEEKIRAVLSEDGASSIRKAFSAAKSTHSGYQWAERIYSFLNRSLRFST
jgi:hypothetical protein